MSKAAVYVFCVIAAARRPRVPAKTRPLPDLGPVRILDVDGGTYLVVADAPLEPDTRSRDQSRACRSQMGVSRRRGSRIGIESFVDQTRSCR
jgi:hypothetical protein